MAILKSKIMKKAGFLVRDGSRLNQLLKETQMKAGVQQKKVQQFWGDLKSLHRMVLAWVRGDYRAVPYKSLLSAVGALLYFVNPLDLIPDPLLGGFVDDALVVGYVLSSIKYDLEKFLQWSNIQSR